MKLDSILSKSQKPAIYEKGTAVMWTDEYISEQLLAIHLNAEIDLASRKTNTIKQTVEWMLKQSPGKELTILDLGCGPGLYAELLAEKGHKVTGVDFSKSSIEYARKQAREKKLGINYINSNYLDLKLDENTFDLVILVYTDFGVLLPEEQKKLLQFIYRVLKPGGIFIFDVLNDVNLEQKITPKNWEIAANGFWKPEPYLALSESFLYEKEKVILYQHLVLDEKERLDVYRFWTHFFSHADLAKLLTESGFEEYDFFEDVLLEENLFSGKNVTFTVARKESI
ncbi:methyltransferase domain-containing protein [uncultured Draconibacterium sp.]|uniref:class I SAM-dependent methyltransferase n=1 Tax=uncultured Draconibacterium sp. TaxID=1573823 RepID=UPI003217C5F5